MLQPSEQVWRQMQVENAGLWIERLPLSEPDVGLIAKLPNHLVRAVNLGAEVAILIGVIEVDKTKVVCFGISVADDVVSPFISYGHLGEEWEVEYLKKALRMASIPMQLFNELSLPIFCATCSWEQSVAQEATKLLTDTTPHYTGRLSDITETALDIFQKSYRDKKTDPKTTNIFRVPVTFCDPSRINVHVIGAGEFHLEDKNEGDELERLVFRFFESLCQPNAFHSPTIGEGESKRELTDILAFTSVPECSEEGLFLLETKAMSMFNNSSDRSTERRAKSIQKQIDKAITQLQGAIRQIKMGTTIHSKSNEPINLGDRAKNIGHGIVMVSELHSEVDWSSIFEKICSATEKTRYMIHILDLIELQRLIKYCNGRPALFESHLIERWNAVGRAKNPLMRVKFKVF